MFAVRGVYDGKTVQILSMEPLPKVNHKIPVIITFLDAFEEMLNKEEKLARRRVIAEAMNKERQVTGKIGINVKDLIEEGRNREGIDY